MVECMKRRLVASARSPRAKSAKRLGCQLSRLTIQISLTANSFPPPFLPLTPTKQPANMPMPPQPAGALRTFISASNLRSTRDPLPSMRDDSSQVDVSVILALSLSGQRRPTAIMSSCRAGLASAEGGCIPRSLITHLGLRSRVTKLVHTILVPESFCRFVNLPVQGCTKHGLGQRLLVAERRL